MSKAYRYGYLVEHRCRELLQKQGAIVFRSAGSRGVADLIAFFPETKEIWLVQVKKEEAPKNLTKLQKRFADLKALAGNYTCKSMVFMKKNRRYRFIDLNSESPAEL